MIELEILQRLREIAEAAVYSLQDGEPIYLKRVIEKLDREIAQEPKP